MTYPSRPNRKPDIVVRTTKHESLLMWIVDVKDDSNAEMLYILDNGNWDKDLCSIMKIINSEILYNHSIHSSYHARWIGEEDTVPVEDILNAYKEHLTKIVEQQLLDAND